MGVFEAEGVTLVCCSHGRSVNHTSDLELLASGVDCMSTAAIDKSVLDPAVAPRVVTALGSLALAGGCTKALAGLSNVGVGVECWLLDTKQDLGRWCLVGRRRIALLAGFCWERRSCLDPW
jgi:hypothetical protein